MSDSRSVDFEQMLGEMKIGKETPELELEESILRLSRPFREVEYQDAGSVEADVDGNKLFLSYLDLDEDSKIEVVDYLRDLLGKAFEEGKISNHGLENVNNWRRVDRLIFQVGGKEINLLEIGSKKYKILFCPKTANFDAAQAENTIFILGSMITPRAIIALAHEIGHIQDGPWSETAKAGEQEGSTLEDKKAFYEETIRRERTASAFALRILRPYVKNLIQEQDIINLIHEGLHRYRERIRKEISTQN